MAKVPREVLLVGSVPIRPVTRVFETVAQHLGTRAKRIPDGEMKFWLRDVWRSHAQNPMLEECGVSKLNGNAPFVFALYRVKAGLSSKDLKLGPYGYAGNARASYAEFKRLRDAGKIPVGTRFQMTMAGHGTTAYPIQMTGAELLPIAAAALQRELAEVIASIPAEDLTIQLDVAMEAEHEEYLRAPGRFDTPVHEIFHWTLDEMADAVGQVANAVPAEVELGFHICSIWHHDPAGGQDNGVLVAAANALSERISRPIAYIHIPVVPEHHSAKHYAPFGELKLHPETKLILGLLNLCDGLDGARTRIALAEAVVKDFGIGFFCGLGMPIETGDGTAIMREMGLRPTSAELEKRVQQSPVPLRERAKRAPNDPALMRASAVTLDQVLELHRKAADL